MNKTKIDWCDSTWNPVTGCLHGCEYCYARGITKRFGCHATPDNKTSVVVHPWEDSETGRKLPYPYDFAPTLHKYRLNEYQNKKGRNIFVCSMADLFGEWVPENWIDEVFNACEKAQQHNYLFLTKNPKRYAELQDRKRIIKKDNMWYGASITDGKTLMKFANCYSRMHFGTKLFLSVEPILSDISKTATWNECVGFCRIDWVVIGAETGRRKDKVAPERKWIENIVNDCKKEDIPVFMKSSLAGIWSEPLIREFPKQLIN